jgi:hypothetical protein
MTTLILMATDNKKGPMLIAIRHFKQVIPHLNPIYENKDILSYIVRDFNLSKEQAELFGSRLKWWNLLHRYTE